MMSWKELLCADRLMQTSTSDDDGRSPFQKDNDRIVFSSPFRRLANKTQVHPLAEDDHIHTRLTHSIETGAVGRSLGTIVGSDILMNMSIKGINKDDFGHVVQAACLAHDIGNPPYGHAGEDAIGSWFKDQFSTETFKGWSLTKRQKVDLERFEGNAQGFRVITQLNNHKWGGGLQLTYAVLGAFAKYPCTSHPRSPDDKAYIGGKKFSFFQAEKHYFDDVAKHTGLISRSKRKDAWVRHPLAFLVEAADDICYNIVDVEDAYTLRSLSYKETKKLLNPLTKKLPPSSNMEDWEKVATLRAYAIGESIEKLAKTFINNLDKIMSGTFDISLLEASKINEHFEEIKKTSRENIYTQKRKTEIELAGHKVIHGILDVLLEAMIDLHNNGWNPNETSGHTQKLVRYIERDFSHVTYHYEGLLVMTDYVSGMTDRFALNVYRRLHGHTM